MTGRIKVLVCDDHTLFREGLKSLLSIHSKTTVIVGEARDGNAAVAKAKELRPDVVLLDISMPHLNGLEATRRIVSLKHPPKVLMLTMHNEVDLIARCLEAGAFGCILKDESPSHLIHAIHEAWHGRQYLSPELADKVAKYLRKPTPSKGSSDPLSDREREVLTMLAEGLSTKEIAFRLKLSVRTIEVHKYNLMKKIQVRDTPALVKYALRRRLIRLGPLT